MKIKFKTIQGKYIKVPADIIFDITVNRRFALDFHSHKMGKNDEPMDCIINLLNGAGKIEIIITNCWEVLKEYSEFIKQKEKD